MRPRPRVGRSRAPSTCNRVLFPAPLAPTTATISPPATGHGKPAARRRVAPPPPRAAPDGRQLAPGDGRRPAVEDVQLTAVAPAVRLHYVDRLEDRHSWR